jgi:hypothetical protein
MFENYLLNAEALTRVFNESGTEFGIATTQETVGDWLRQHGREYFLGGENAQKPAPFSADWRAGVNAAALLEDLFAALSNNRLAYIKTTHTPLLTLALNEVDPDAANEIVELVADVLKLASKAVAADQ